MIDRLDEIRARYTEGNSQFRDVGACTLQDIRYLLAELAQLARESVKRELKLAKLEAEVARWAQAEADGLLAVLPCKPTGAYWHRNYDTGQLEINFEMHELREHDDTYPEIDSCAYWE